MFVIAEKSENCVTGSGAFRLIDLFCGAGGLTEGFVNGHPGLFRPVWANDIDGDAVESYTVRFGPHCVHGNLEQVLCDPTVRIPRADVVIGGPPCQGFSLLNRKRDGDSRKQMWRTYMEVVRRSEASLFVMENVPQLLSSKELDEILECAKELGFAYVVKGLLKASDYGVPQTRVRAIIIASRCPIPDKCFPPLRTHFDKRETLGKAAQGLYVENPLPWRSVRDAISDLPSPIGTDIRKNEGPSMTLHFGRNPTEKSLLRYRAIPDEGMNREDLLRNAPEITPPCWINKTGGTDLFGRLWWDRPAVTIRTEFFKPEKGRYLHPEQDRPITHREAARFQGFPDEFLFFGSKTSIARQIGNAVPPPLGKVIAECVLEILASMQVEFGFAYEQVYATG
jgi:DNA (cytosine-5)-methyltransferase 1